MNTKTKEERTTIIYILSMQVHRIKSLRLIEVSMRSWH